MSLACISAAWAVHAAPADDPLLRPIEPEYAKRWLAPQKPVQLFGNSYLVGFGGLSVGLIRTSAGLILIDGAVPQAVPEVEKNLRTLGFSIRDVKYILSTEPHYDHAGGIAALTRDSGATVLASAEGARILKAGGRNPADPQASLLAPFPVPARIRAVRDGEVIKLGNVAVTAVATPGHTLGSMSWRWRSCEEKTCVNALFASSLNPASADGYRFSDPANRSISEAFRRSFARMRAERCGLLLTAHPDQSDGDARYARLLRQRKPNPFIDPGACRVYADRFEAALDKRLSKEISQAQQQLAPQNQ
ncbi:MAG: subclass B3 metallo-beta-lactamase [Sphingobium sp.]